MSKKDEAHYKDQYLVAKPEKPEKPEKPKTK